MPAERFMKNTLSLSVCKTDRFRIIKEAVNTYVGIKEGCISSAKLLCFADSLFIPPLPYPVIHLKRKDFVAFCADNTKISV